MIDANTHLLIDIINEVGNAHGHSITPDKHYLIVGSFSEFPIGESIILRNFVGVSDAEHEEYHAFATYARSGNIGAAWMSVIDSDSGQVVRKKHQAIANS